MCQGVLKSVKDTGMSSLYLPSSESAVGGCAWDQSQVVPTRWWVSFLRNGFSGKASRTAEHVY